MLAATKTGGNPATTVYVGGLEEIVSAGTTTTYSYYNGPNGKPIAEAVNGSLFYLATDHLGTPEVTLQGNGQSLASALYSPYGLVRYASGTMLTDVGFTGQVSDSGSSGLDYYGARYYDPVSSQFGSADTAQDGLNRFGYVHGNPETMTDPSGHCGTFYLPGRAALCGGGGGGGGTCTSNCGSPCTSDCTAGGGGDGMPCDGVKLNQTCWTLDMALRLDLRSMFVSAFGLAFASFFAGLLSLVTAEAAFIDYLRGSGRLASGDDGNRFWGWVDGQMIRDMFAAAMIHQDGGSTGSGLVQNWLDFIADPSDAGFWIAHNGSIFHWALSGDGQAKFGAETRGEQLFINDALFWLGVTAFADTDGKVAAFFLGGVVGWAAVSLLDPWMPTEGEFAQAIYPQVYPAPPSWAWQGWAFYLTSIACLHPVMSIRC